MYLLVRNHRNWILTVLFVVLTRVHRGHCKGEFLKPFFRDMKAGFVKTDEQTYHTAYEFDLDHTMRQTGKFIKRFTESVFTDPPPEEEENLQETSASPEDSGNLDESDATDASNDEEQITSTEAHVEPLAAEHQPPAPKEKITYEQKSSPKRTKPRKKKNKKKYSEPGNFSILKNLRLMFLLPIKVCKYELKASPSKEKAAQGADCCGLIT